MSFIRKNTIRLRQTFGNNSLPPKKSQKSNKNVIFYCQGHIIYAMDKQN